jgi:ubiquinone/menaquinone biosynthesis C-methylase UbiE
MIPYEDNTFDYVFIKSVIEHISNTDLFLSEIYRVLKPGGKVIILTPDYQKQKDFFYDDYTHIKPFTLNSLKMAVQLNGFKIMIGKWFYYYKKIWEGKMFPNGLNCRLGYWLTKVTGIKYFRWGSDRQLFVVGIK